ncbi:MAG TPA: ribonuclease III, partial [Candidatus Scatomorpha stercoravium]|nr:ribonuclease III [Candidatus Scatomorpha stercoravium]
MDMNQDKLNEKAAPAAEKPGEAAPAAPDEGRAEDKAPAAPAAREDHGARSGAED